jgi:hypothetical protein
MFAFRGFVARVMYDFWPGTGQQLQHQLGQIFRQQRLDTLFDKLRLDRIVRAGSGFDVYKHRHVFVYALCGYVMAHADEVAQSDFAGRYFLDGLSTECEKDRPRDPWVQLKWLCQRSYGTSPMLVRNILPERRHRCEVRAGEVLLSAHESRSPRYARQKAIRKAIVALLVDDDARLADDDRYKQVLLERRARQEKERQEESRRSHASFLERQLLQRENRMQRMRALREAMKEKEKRRRRRSTL